MALRTLKYTLAMPKG